MSAASFAPESRRRGACPSLSAPMATGDGLLVRLQPRDGALTPAQLAGLADLAQAHGSGILEVTARGNLQIRGLSEASVAPLAAGVTALGVSPREGVPVERNPLAGLDADETANAAPLADEIQERVARAGLGGRLGPKVTVVVDGGGRFPLSTLLADVRACAQADGGWLVSLGGAQDGGAPVGTYRAGEAAEAVVALLERIAAMGLRARGRDLVPALALAVPLSDGTVGAPLFIGPLVLRDGAGALSVALPFGQVDAPTLSRLSWIAEANGADAVRLASQRRLLVTGLSSAACAELQREAGALGLIVAPGDARLRVVACAGAPACASGFYATKPAALALAPLVGAAGLHLSGCPKGCADPTGTLPALVGVSAREFEAVAGGRRAPMGFRDLRDGLDFLQARRATVAAHPLRAAALSDTGRP